MAPAAASSYVSTRKWRTQCNCSTWTWGHCRILRQRSTAKGDEMDHTQVSAPADQQSDTHAQTDAHAAYRVSQSRVCSSSGPATSCDRFKCTARCTVRQARSSRGVEVQDGRDRAGTDCHFIVHGCRERQFATQVKSSRVCRCISPYWDGDLAMLASMLKD